MSFMSWLDGLFGFPRPLKGMRRIKFHVVKHTALVIPLKSDSVERLETILVMVLAPIPVIQE
jgi:hypothetical protein